LPRIRKSGVLLYRLHALDIATGAEKFGGPVQLSGSVPGTAADGTTVPFNVQWENQGPGLLLLNGYVFYRPRLARRQRFLARLGSGI